MRPDERQAKIIDILRREKRVDTKRLAYLFNVTGETIRKDLVCLCRDNSIIRTHGGIMWNGYDSERPVSLKSTQNLKEKQAIVKYASRFLSDGDYIFVDSGSTNYYLADYIGEHSNMVVATNSLPFAQFISAYENIRLLITGGFYRSMSMSFAGAAAEDQLLKLHVPKAFMSCEGIDLEYGIMDGDEDESRVKQKVFETAKEIYLLADHTKFRIKTYNFLRNVRDVTAVITDSGLPEEVAEEYRRNGVNLIIADM